MPFQKGNKLGGRTKGATNNLTKEIKEILQEVVFNADEIRLVYHDLEPHQKAQ